MYKFLVTWPDKVAQMCVPVICGKKLNSTIEDSISNVSNMSTSEQ